MLLEQAKTELKAAVEAKDSVKMAKIVVKYLEMRGHVPSQDTTEFLACSFLMGEEMNDICLMGEFKFSWEQAALIKVDLAKLWEYRDYNFPIGDK